MASIKNVYIKAPKKTINNKNIKMVIKKNSLKKINGIHNSNISKEHTKNKDEIKNYNSINKENIKIIKKNDSKNILDKFRSNKKTFEENSKNVNNIAKKFKKYYSRNKNNIKRLNVKKNNSKKKDKYVRLLIDSDIDVKGRIETKKKFHNNLMKLTKKQIKKVLIKKGLIKKNSRAPLKLLTDIYLNSKLLGDINVIQQK
jgi:hypothetical protein